MKCFVELRPFVLSALSFVSAVVMAMSPRESAEVYGADARVRIVVTDDDNHVVSNADVEVYFSLSVREGRTCRGKTDASGTFSVSGKTTGDVLVNVSRQGFYRTAEKLQLAEDESREVKNRRWMPEEIVTNVVLRAIVNPVDLKTTEWPRGFLIPQVGTPIGLDLEKQDWIKPWGNGEVADFEVEYVSDGKRGREYTGAKLRIKFVRPFDGAYECKLRKSSTLETVHRADTNHVYLSELCYWEERGAKGRFEGHLLGEDDLLVLRTRCRVDRDGRFQGGQYSMIVGGIRFGWSRKAVGAIRFHTYLNPTFNDPNLEAKSIYNTPNFRAIGGR